MKIIKKVDRLEVKRAFVTTFYFRKHGIALQQNGGRVPPRSQYLKILKTVKKQVGKLNEAGADKHIIGKNGGWNQKRLAAYNTAHWFLAEVSPKELGVWRKAGGLPKIWTNTNLIGTAHFVKEALKENSKLLKSRAKRAIPAIIEFKKIMQKEKILYPIAFEANQGTTGRRWLVRTKFDLDDGSMRTIAYALSGDEKIRLYVGIMPERARRK